MLILMHNKTKQNSAAFENHWFESINEAWIASRKSNNNVSMRTLSGIESGRTLSILARMLFNDGTDGQGMEISIIDKLFRPRYVRKCLLPHCSKRAGSVLRVCRLSLQIEAFFHENICNGKEPLLSRV